MNFTSKEMLTHYLMAGHVHLSKKDYGFFNNIYYIATSKKSITSNQDKLFNKLISKYQRQLRKLGHETESLQSLNWKVGLVDSKQEYLTAKVSIENNFIKIATPFNSKFIQDLKRLNLNHFIWNKTDKFYKAPYSTYNLKSATDLVTTHFNDKQFCETTSYLLDKVQEYKSVKFWNPTMIKSGNQFYIVAINETLAEKIQDLNINDDPTSLFKLSQYGIFIDESVHNHDDQLRFSGNFNIVSDLENLDKIINFLTVLNVDHVFTSRDLIYNKTISNEVKMKLLERNITCCPLSSDYSNYTNAVIFTTSSVTHNMSNKVSKCVQLKNSRPINIK